MLLQVVAIVSLVAAVIGIIGNLARISPEEAFKNLGKWGKVLYPAEFFWRKAVAFSTSAAGRTLTGVLFSVGFGIIVLQPILSTRVDDVPITGAQGPDPLSHAQGSPQSPGLTPGSEALGPIPDGGHIENRKLPSESALRDASNAQLKAVLREIRDDMEREEERFKWRREFIRRGETNRGPDEKELAAIKEEELRRFYQVYWPRIRPVVMELDKRVAANVTADRRRSHREAISRLNQQKIASDTIFLDIGLWLLILDYYLERRERE